MVGRTGIWRDSEKTKFTKADERQGIVEIHDRPCPGGTQHKEKVEENLLKPTKNRELQRTVIPVILKSHGRRKDFLKSLSLDLNLHPLSLGASLRQQKPTNKSLSNLAIQPNSLFLPNAKRYYLSLHLYRVVSLYTCEIATRRSLYGIIY